MLGSGMEFVNLLQEVPKDLRDIFSQFKQGKIKIEFEHRGLEPMLTTPTVRLFLFLQKKFLHNVRYVIILLPELPERRNITYECDSL